MQKPRTVTKKSHLKPEMTSAITTTTTSTSSHDMIKTKIESATEGLPSTALTIFL